MNFVLKREDGKFVAHPGSEKSYTRKIELARVYFSREAAEADKCGNETIVTVRAVTLREIVVQEIA